MPTLAILLAGAPTSFVSADVMLGSDETVVGSFTVDGLTYAVGDEGAMLVAVSPLASADGVVAVPASVTYDGATYNVTSIDAYAFYLSGATGVVIPASVASVDECAFRSSDVERVEVADENPIYSSYDGALYSAGQTSLLLIPEGRTGVVRIPSHAALVDPSVFSHCAGVDAIVVDADCPHLSSEDGLLYNVDGTTLLRVPAGAVDIVIRDGCTTIAAGAMEGCAKLERITAPASVTSISPDIFESVPTISLPVIALQDESVVAPLADAESASTDNSTDTKESPAQLTAMVALSAADDGIPEVDASSILAVIPEGSEGSTWENAGLLTEMAAAHSIVEMQSAAVAKADPNAIFEGNGGTFYSSFSQKSTSGISHLFPIGGRLVVTTSTVTFYNSSNQAIEQLSNATRTGYTYRGWNTSSTATTGLNTTYNWTSTSAGTWYCVWTANSYTVTLNRNGGSGGTGSVTATYDSNMPSMTKPTRAGFTFQGYYDTSAATGGTQYYTATGASARKWNKAAATTLYARWSGNTITCSWDSQGGSSTASTSATYSTDAKVPMPASDPTRAGYTFAGWWTAATDGTQVTSLTVLPTSNPTYYARWYPDYEISFDTSSEPDDDNYEGLPIEPDIVTGDRVQAGDHVSIESPLRPGYVFQGWVLTNGDKTEAVDENLVYQGEDGKWYVDAAKLPDYATDGKVELTARWTSIVSVDVPNAVTFYADTVTQGQESREGTASSAFGQSKVESRSEVDLRVVGLESSAVETTDTMFGADSILKKSTTATPASSAQKLLSLYPSSKAWTAEELQDPAAVAGVKAANAVDFDLDDIILEAAFDADGFTIPAGETLNLGYRLNLTEAGQELDYEKLATLEDGQSASIANVSYCFSADPTPAAWDEPLWVKNEDPSLGRVGYYLLDDIKEAAEDLSAHSDDPTQSEYYTLYKGLLDAQVTNNGNPGVGPYFKVRIDGVYWDLQLIGICQDTKTAGGKAGLTFQLRDIFAYMNKIWYPGNGTYVSTMNPLPQTNAGGWQSSNQRKLLRGSTGTGSGNFYGYLAPALQGSIVQVNKYQQAPGGKTAAYLQKTTGETIWLPSMYEVFGAAFTGYNESEGIATVAGYTPFQYMAYQGNGGATVNAFAIKKYFRDASDTSGIPYIWWFRSAAQDGDMEFCEIDYEGQINMARAAYGDAISPAFCL